MSNFYKTPSNEVHVIEPQFAYMLPAGSVPITEDEAAELLKLPREQLVAQAWSAIRARRDKLRFDGGVKVNGHWFKSNQIATAEYNSIISLGLPDSTVLRANWRTMDNCEVAMTPLLAKQIIQAGFAQAAAIDDAAQTHKVAMEESAEPSRYDFSGGWPASFGDTA